MGTELNIDPVIIRGEELKNRGFGGACTEKSNILSF